MNNSITVNLDCESETKKIAELIAINCGALKDRFIIYLSGNLGAGKTTFSQYFIFHWAF